ncbi:hypothetical protein ACKI1Z_41515, partial [Streptomyces galilaeus]|uniref:hypothetical protein n=1 Tax=Streptomyces galilaeus TaxID=33899 RepID=UPI0038F5E5B9
MTAFADPENWMGADTAFGQSTGIYDPSNPYHSPTTGNDSPNYRPLFQGKTRADWDQYQSEAAQWAAQQQSQQAAQFRAKSA